jgi:hypothetical protein
MQQRGTGTMSRSPVDDETYNILQTLTSKLEALDIYARYEKDSKGEVAALFREMAEQDQRAAERLVEVLRERLASR